MTLGDVDYETAADEMSIDAQATADTYALTKTDPQTAYFQALHRDRPIGAFIASVLIDSNPKAAVRLDECGTKRVSADAPIELRKRENGGVYASNVRWCGMRYCPTCGPRISSQRRSIWSQQANAAAALGWFAVAATFSGGTVESGLQSQLGKLQQEFRRAFPPRSRWPKLQQIPSYLGAAWALEPDFVMPQEDWNPHIHATFWLEAEPTAEEIEALLSRWTMGKRWGKPAKSAGAWAAYIVKGQPLPSKPHNLGLFELARLEMAEQVDELLLALNGRKLAQGAAALRQFGKEADDAGLLKASDRKSKKDVSLETMSLGRWRAALGR